MSTDLQRGLLVQTFDYCRRLGGHEQAQRIQDLQHPLSASETGISSTRSVVTVSCSSMHTPYRNFTRLSSFDRTKSIYSGFRKLPIDSYSQLIYPTTGWIYVVPSIAGPGEVPRL